MATRLNNADPFYRYEVRVGEHLPTDIPDGLIMRRATYGNAWCIVIDLFPRFAESSLWSPPSEDLEVTFTLRPDRMDDATRDQLHQTLHGSDSVVLLPGEIEDFRLRAPAGWADHQSTPTIRMTPFGPAPLRRRWRITDPNGRTITEVMVVFRHQPAPGGAGITVTGREANGAFAVDVANHGDHVGMTVRATGQDIADRPVRDIAAGVAFLAAWHAPNTMITGLEAGEVLTHTPIELQQAPLPAAFTKHVADLAVIQEHTDTLLRVPAEFDDDQIDMAASIRWLLAGEAVQLDEPGEGARLVLGGSVTPAEAENMRQATEPFPVSIPAPCPLELRNAGQPVSLPDVVCEILAAGLDGPPQPAANGLAEVRFRLADNTAPIIYIPSPASASPKAVEET
ncbi:hypothetical protein AB0L88_09115 [Saccharopolyspora shandongensis]|uniref:hypothetical protein n=1 Tax=Saccharopolyspora shandongensis TaxID=418495 RepID=UPI00343D4C60